MAADPSAQALVRATAATLAAELRRQAELGVRGIQAADATRILARLDAIEGALVGVPHTAAPNPAPLPARPAAAAPAPAPARPSAPAPVPVAAVPLAAAPVAASAPPAAAETARFPWIPDVAHAPAAAPGRAQISSMPQVADRDAAIREIREDLGDCRRCGLCSDRTNIVFGVGSPNTRLMFVGEGPGRDEDLQGEPFVGAAGQLLNRMIEAMTLSRERVYIANVIKCRPPNNRDPAPDEISKCLPFLIRQIEAIRPEIIVTLGRHSFHALSGTTAGISTSRGKFFDYRGIPVMPTFHPAYVLRKEGDELRETRKLVWDDLQAVMKRLGLEPAKRTS